MDMQKGIRLNCPIDKPYKSWSAGKRERKEEKIKPIKKYCTSKALLAWIFVLLKGDATLIVSLFGKAKIRFFVEFFF
jgi:hypothetical protein